ncbi:MAG: DUF308 domain-containing protein [Lachnospiraceae bacterium]|nr:DUF308 domain-containing protein [Lachnospiraceae bacterium]
MKFVKICSVVIGILMIVTGLYCIFNPGITYLSIGYAIGISMILDAFGRFYAWWQLKKEGQADGWMLVGSILSAVFGIILITDAAAQLSVDVFIAYMAAAWILIHAVITVIRALNARKLHKTLETRFVGKHWWLGMVIGILMCIFAILSLMNPGVIMASIGIFIGLGVITAGANMIMLATTPANK